MTAMPTRGLTPRSGANARAVVDVAAGLIAEAVFTLALSTFGAALIALVLLAGG